MSHVATVAIRVRNFRALAKACERLGLEFAENQKTFKWWGRWYNDYHAEDAAYRQGVAPADYGKCDHAIRIKGRAPGSAYEVGLIPYTDGDGYRLIFDFMGTELVQRVGGKSCEKLAQEYAIAVLEDEPHMQELLNQGYTLERQTQQNGDIQLVLSQGL